LSLPYPTLLRYSNGNISVDDAMNITILKENLQPLLALTSRYVSTRPALPVLANILMETQDDNITISATNLDITVKATLPAHIAEHGKLTLPARPFAEILNQLPAGEIKLFSDQEVLKLESRGTEATFATIPAIDFPVLPRFDQAHATSFPFYLLQEVGEKVLFAAATDESRPVLTSLLIRQTNDGMTVVATDGFRLSEVKITAQPNGQAAADLLLPARVIGELTKIATDQTKELWIDMSTQANQVALKVGQVEFFSKLIDAAYPDYTRIIPTDFMTHVIIDREELIQAVKIAMVFARDAGSLIKLTVDPARSQMDISAQSANLGQNHTSIAVKGAGQELVTAFNSRFLIDALSAFKNDQLRLDFKAPLAPMLITTPDQPGFRHIVMPIKIDE
jgi:DNA polymerase-3 subunit beta